MATSHKRWALRALTFLAVEERINGNLSEEVGIESLKVEEGPGAWFWQVIPTEPLEHQTWLRGVRRCEMMCAAEEMGGPECRWVSTL